MERDKVLASVAEQVATMENMNVVHYSSNDRMNKITCDSEHLWLYDASGDCYGEHYGECELIPYNMIKDIFIKDGKMHVVADTTYWDENDTKCIAHDKVFIWDGDLRKV